MVTKPFDPLKKKWNLIFRVGRLGRTAIVAVFLLISGWTARTEALSAEIYQFIDANGVIHFSNVPTDQRYRPVQDSASAVQPSLSEIYGTILTAARRYRVDPALVKAVIKVESDFDARAVSIAGAMGLMQLMPATAALMKVRDPFDAADNIFGGVKHLGQLLTRFNGDLTFALAAYHAGAERVEQYGWVPPIEQTHRYIRKVMTAYQAYRGKERSGAPVYKVSSADDRLVIYTNTLEPYQDTRRYRVAYAK